jgi:hypothetical protein
MGRLKEFERRREREAVEDGPAIYSHPVRCAMPKCEARSALGFEGREPVPIAVFHDDGWVAIPDIEKGVLAFVCQECYQKETARQGSETTADSQVSG